MIVTITASILYVVGYLLCWPSFTHAFIADLGRPTSRDRLAAFGWGTFAATLWPLILLIELAVRLLKPAVRLLMQSDVLRSDAEIEEREHQREAQRQIREYNEQVQLERLAESAGLTLLTVRAVPEDDDLHPIPHLEDAFDVARCPCGGYDSPFDHAHRSMCPARKEER